MKLFDLSGKVALVTGGSRGLGRAMALALAQAGADVVLSGRNSSTLEQAAQQIQQQTQRQVRWVVADLEHRQQCQHLAQQALRIFGHVDILINNAGTNVPQQIDQIEDSVWDRLVELNLSSCMALSRALVPGMKERRWGRIIHISSIMAFVSKEGRNAYSATKAALVGMCRAMALELGPWGITVNCIAPGPFLTELPLSLFSQEQQQQVAQRTALKRWGRPEELAGPVLLLASEAGSYITGETLVVDGGSLCVSF